MDILSLIGRHEDLFSYDIGKNEEDLSRIIRDSRFLILGGAGSIGQSVAKEIFKRNPRKLHVVDISENNLVELVRDLRSSFGYIKGDFKTFALDIGSVEYDSFIQNGGGYDFILNLSALKHVRSEKDPYTLMRMIDVNIMNTQKTIDQAVSCGSSKYFCVSTDKAADPANMMGASKRIMEMFLIKKSTNISISTARFANVAFSDGSLLFGFNQRISKKQPIVAPNDVKRYFVTPQESGELCLMSCIMGSNCDILFPKLSEKLNLLTFSEIAVRYLNELGYEPYLCKTEDEAREIAGTISDGKRWPCLFEKSDTTGEKEIEEFYTKNEEVCFDKFKNIGVIKNKLEIDEEKLDDFNTNIELMKKTGIWSKKQIVDLFFNLIPDFSFIEKGRYLDSKM
ncbi:MAG: UDP-N-acetylglucosamine 4,6-dehydratase [Bacteroidales bacterium]|jgi:FlaA1/EpsC-like NDP-sugar epimerase|nr:UDP-N-acetylglucosamine 4,6-dehydratase [Bacteroidales bacterium]